MPRPLLCDPLARAVLAALRWDPSVLRGASASPVGRCVRAAWIDAHRLPGWMRLAAPLVARGYPAVGDAYRGVLRERRGAAP